MNQRTKIFTGTAGAVLAALRSTQSRIPAVHCPAHLFSENSHG
jgi:hypothetical protein